MKGQTQLTVYKNSTNRTVDFYNVDLDDKIAFPLTFSIADIREPQSRNSTYSKTIVVPGTDNNNKVFGFLFDISASGSYDPNLKVDCEVISGCQRVLKGVLRLAKVNRDRSLNAISYEINIFGSLSNIFQTIGEAELTDLDFSEFDHAWTRDNVMNSWYQNIQMNGATHSNWSYAAVTTFTAPYNNGGRLEIQLGSTAGVSITPNETMALVLMTSFTPGNQNAYASGYCTIRSVNMSTGRMVLNLPYLALPAYGGTIRIDHQNDGKGYVYPLIDEGYSAGTQYAVMNFKPSIYVKQYVDKIFEAAGFTYESDFLNSAFFKRLILPFSTNEFKLTAAQIENRSTRVYLGSDITETISGQYMTASSGWPSYTVNNTWYKYRGTTTSGPGADIYGYPATTSGSTGATAGLRFDTVDYDTGGNYNTANGVWTCPANGYYTLGTMIQTNAYMPWATSSTGASYSVYISSPISGGLQFSSAVQKRLNTFGSNQLTYASPVTHNFYPFGSTVTQTSTVSSVYLQTGDKISVKWNFNELFLKFYYPSEYNSWSGPVFDSNYLTRTPLTVPTLTRKVINGSQFSVGVASTTLQESNMLSLNDCIVKGVKQKDLLLNLIKMFNLYVEVDENDPKKLIITPRNDYYDTTRSVDWTRKLDVSQPFVIDTMTDIKAKKYTYTYTEDKDFFNEDHQKSFAYLYGTYEQLTNSDFSTETKETKLTFSPTVLADYPVGSDRVVSQIISLDSNGQVKQIAYKPRILFFGLRGTKDTWALLSSASGSVSLNWYPYCGHLDNHMGAMYDLNFGFPRGVYYNYTTWTDNNLFNMYHRNYVEEISDPDARMVTATFLLNANDIANLDFRVPVVVDRVMYRLNKISDWDPDVQLCKVELIKAKNLPRFTMAGRNFVSSWQIAWPQQIGTDIFGTAVLSPIPVQRDPNATPASSSALGSGSQVNVDSGASVLVGNNNVVSGTGSGVVSIGASNNNLGFSNVLLIGEGLTATKSNQLVSQGLTIDFDTGVIQQNINRAIAPLNKVWEPFPSTQWANFADGSVDDVTGSRYPDYNTNREIGGFDTV